MPGASSGSGRKVGEPQALGAVISVYLGGHNLDVDMRLRDPLVLGRVLGMGSSDPGSAIY